MATTHEKTRALLRDVPEDPFDSWGVVMPDRHCKGGIVHARQMTIFPVTAAMRQIREIPYIFRKLIPILI